MFDEFGAAIGWQARLHMGAEGLADRMRVLIKHQTEGHLGGSAGGNHGLEAIAGVYDQLLAQHDEPFKSITKSVTDVSLSIIEGSLEEFRDIIKALPQKTEISTPGRPKRFIAIGISIAAMAMSTFNTVRITQLNEEISTLKEKTDLILDVVHLHEKHLHHIEEKLEQTNKLLADLLEANVWFTSKVTDAIEKKFESVIWHHENVVKSAQHHRLAPGALPHDVLDSIIEHVTAVAKKKNLIKPNPPKKC